MIEYKYHNTYGVPMQKGSQSIFAKEHQSKNIGEI